MWRFDKLVEYLQNKQHSNMKQLKDYLHLYLGCECYYDTTHCAGKLIGIEDDGAFTWDAVNGRTGWPLKRLIPILRPLSDMTFDEKNEKNRIWVDFEKDAAFYEETRYLLSKHFDLFGLIEAGLAIDLTKLTL